MHRTLITAALLVATPAFAQVPRTAKSDAGYPRTTILEGFLDEEVRGQTWRPGGDVIDVVKKAHRSSLIRVRASFLPEMLKSAEQL